MEPEEPTELTIEERRNIEADLDDLSAMRSGSRPRASRGWSSPARTAAPTTTTSGICW